MTLKYESELLFDLMKRDGDDAPSDVLPYESELKEKYIEQVVGAYPKLQDYQAEWLNYNLSLQLPSDFPVESVTNVTSASFYNVVPDGYKSAILKGRTLVNVNRSNYITNTNITDDYGQAIEFYDADMLPNTTYTIIMYSDNPYECRFSQMYNDREYALSIIKVGTPFVFTTVENYQGLRSYLKGDELNIPQGTEIKILIIEGDYTNIDIPYFEGMQSVKMPVLTTTGKNLFDINHFSKLENWDGKVTSQRPYYAYEMKLKPNTSYTFSRKENSKGDVYFCISKNKGVYDMVGGIIHPTVSSGTAQQRTITTDLTGILYFNLYQAPKELANLISLLEDTQLEEGSVATSYEPYKTNILTVNDDVTLHGIGNVQDELDLLTGEVTERIGEIVLDGSSDEKYDINGYTTEGLTRFVINSISNRKQRGNTISNLLPIVDNSNAYGLFSGSGLNIMNNCSTVDDLRIWLQQNPITIQYQLATESIKTVDLTVTDQDGNTKSIIRPIEGTMHVSTSSQTLPPLLDMSVPIEATTQNLMSFANIVEEEK